MSWSGERFPSIPMTMDCILTSDAVMKTRHVDIYTSEVVSVFLLVSSLV